VPDRDVALAEEDRDLLRRPPGDGERERRHAILHRLEPVEPAALRESGEEALPELALPAPDRVPADRAEVVDRRDEAGEELVGKRPRLVPVAERLVRRRAHLVR